MNSPHDSPRPASTKDAWRGIFGVVFSIIGFIALVLLVGGASMYGWIYLKETWKWPVWTMGIAFLPSLALLIYFCEDAPRPWRYLWLAVLIAAATNIGPWLSKHYSIPHLGIWAPVLCAFLFGLLSKRRKAE